MIQLPAQRAVLQPHSVKREDGTFTAGYLVRCSASRREMGHVWWMHLTNVWGWRTPDGQHYGERQTRHAAIDVLRQAFDLAHDITNARVYRAQPTVDLRDSSTTHATTASSARATTTTTTKTAAAPAPRVPSTPQITWTNDASADLTAAVAAALRKETSK